ncbi:Alkali-sensitive linkage protein 1 [Hypsizygus marmoreus]|uniref:Alkali-sensitive linkage protein 1 n=1 Tax=Hypsizygus marmoreus TaxID=39966 RepID=A0A369K222_HYPMA|nr:Alkali-sensitive linkage protein 1 [Hypsizygus marmoreus]
MFSFRLALWSSVALLMVSAAPKNSKRGLAFAAGDTPGDLNNANQTKSLVSWQYDWGNSPAVYLATSKIEYIPMQWGSGKIEQFADAVKTQGAKTILAFNEPDFDKESNMKPTEAADLWMKYLEPLKADGIRLGGPAITAAGTGKPWLEAFFAACKNCTVDFLPLHWYGEGEESFYQYIGEIHGLYPKLPLWITEYASTSVNDTVVANFLNATTSFMDTLDWVERYAWFGFFRPREDAHYNLLGEDGSLNTLGQIYVGAKTVHTQVITQPPTKSFRTVNGADSPTQSLVTTYAAYNGSPHQWNILGVEAISQMLGFGTALAACVVGAVWTIW